MRSGKELVAARLSYEEAQAKRIAEEREREKRKVAEEKKKMQEILRQDKIARFGHAGPAAAAPGEPGEKTPVERMQHAIKTIKTLYPNFRNPGKARTCVSTLLAYIGNIVNNPLEEKFRRIRTTNKAFQDRVASCTGGVMFLNAAGFEQQDEFLVNMTQDIRLMESAVRLLNETLATLDN